MTKLFLNDDLELIKYGDNSTLMSDEDECCCGGVPLQNCTDIVDYLMGRSVKTITSEGFVAVGDCTFCPTSLSKVCADPERENNEIGVVWRWEGTSEDWCGNGNEAGLATVIMRCQSPFGQPGGLSVSGSFVNPSNTERPLINDCNDIVTWTPTYFGFFPWPGMGFPVDSDWLDQSFEIDSEATASPDCGCSGVGLTAIVG